LPGRDELSVLDPPLAGDLPQRVLIGSRDDQFRSGLEFWPHVLSMEITSTRCGLARGRDFEAAEQMLAHLQRLEHLAAQADDLGRPLEDAGAVVGDRVFGETGGQSIPIAIVDRGRITDQYVVDRASI
jgi:hypothetical protein